MKSDNTIWNHKLYTNRESRRNFRRKNNYEYITHKFKCMNSKSKRRNAVNPLNKKILSITKYAHFPKPVTLQTLKYLTRIQKLLLLKTSKNMAYYNYGIIFEEDKKEKSE